MCLPGYSFTDGNCVALTGKQSPPGCLLPMAKTGNGTDEKLCLVCNSGYHMTSAQACVADVAAPANPNTKFDSIKTIMAAVMMLLMMF